MAVSETALSGVPERRRTASLWSDALYRLGRNRAAIVGGAMVLLLTLSAIFAAQIAPYSYSDQDRNQADAVPEWMTVMFPTIKPYAKISEDFPLGSDYVGRDLLSRIIYGAQISLSVALVGPVIALLVGTVYGLVSGYLGGRVDDLMMRFVDIMYAFPTMLLIILLMAFFRSTFSECEPCTFAYTLNAID